MLFKFFSQHRLYLFVLGGLFCLFLSFTTVLAEENIDDAPIIISEANSTRALTVAARSGLNLNSRVFSPDEKTRITIFVTGINLLSNEDANAFRADATDGRFNRFPLQIISLAPIAVRPWVYALTFKLHPGMGNVGDVLLRVAWRGMKSNGVRVAIGHFGDGLPDDEGAVPTPMPERPVTSYQPSSAGLPYTGNRVRFMNQATFGGNPALEHQLRRIGYSTWISQQMETKLDANNAVRYSTFSMPNPPLQPDNIPTTCVGNCVRNNYTMYPLQNWFFREALYSEDQQLRRRVSWALHQILVVSGRRMVQPSRMAPYIRILDKNAFGNFRTLLEEMTISPTMGFYLDMAVSTRQNPNENYARELLELFSIGHSMLNQDGTPVTDAQGSIIPAYTQETVNNFTKVFTGWRLCNTNCPNSVPGIRNFIDPMEFIPGDHDQTEKHLLDYPGANSVLPAGQSGEVDLDAALDNIFYHPNTAPFISKSLILQLVTSNPTPAYVRRVADVFSDVRGGGMDRGNLGKVIRAILLDPEARGNIKTDPDYGHLKEPVIFVTNFLRALDPTANDRAAANCNRLSDGVLNGITLILDQDVFIPPGVFSYYSPIYSLPNTNLFAPEFGILTTATALKRLNVVNQFIPPANIPALPGITADTAQNTPCGTRVTLARYLSLAEADPTGTLLVDTLNRELLNGSMSSTVKTQILNAVQAVATDDALKRTRTALYLLFTSPQYQVQR